MPKKTKTKKAAEAMRRQERARHSSSMPGDDAQTEMQEGAPAQDISKA